MKHSENSDLSKRGFRVFRCFSLFFVIFRDKTNHSNEQHSYRKSAGEQPEGRDAGHPPRQAGGNHRAFRIGQEFIGVRYALCRRPTAVCGKPEQLCPPVPGPHEQARMRLYHRSATSHRHRAESNQPQPTKHRWHLDRNLRVPAATLCTHRTYLQPHQRRRGEEAHHRGRGALCLLLLAWHPLYHELPHPCARGTHAAEPTAAIPATRLHED